MNSVETASMMSDVGLNTCQLRILLWILRNKVCSKLFELEYKRKELFGETNLPIFGEYSYIYENSSKHELILFWMYDSTANFLRKRLIFW